VVKKGDTLLAIAKKFGSDTDKIVEANGLVNTASLSIGQRLILPGGKLPVVVPVAPTNVATNIKNVLKPAPSPDAKTSLTKLLWPSAARRISQYYKFKHTGVDIAGPVGTSIYAADDGTVSFAGWNNGGYGNMIVIDHGNGLYTRYAHSSKLLVKVGDVVKRGDTISLMGSTGRSTGPHLHFEVMTGTVSHRVNPFDYTK
jgi:murein DD-endopeptidase MepM/ murein hydrolase activator NlpD